MVLLQGYLEWIMGLKIPIVNIYNLFSPMMKIVTLIVSQFEIRVLRLFGQELRNSEQLRGLTFS